MRLKRVIVTGVAALCAALTVSAACGPPAGASALRPEPPTTAPAEPGTLDTRYNCGYPLVCFYKTEADWNARTRTAAYRDITSGWQTLSSAARGSYTTFNSRNDDGVLFHYTNGGTICLGPDSLIYHNSWVVDKVRIMNSPTC